MSEWSYIKKRIIKMPLGIFIILFYIIRLKFTAISYYIFLEHIFIYQKDKAATQVNIELPH